ncbi:MAG TPA: hypothetical protein VE907_19690 [Gammaproteobacteria bacterium]|nr:hypothetical protein [Gammaproteobacteria bacterium]
MTSRCFTVEIPPLAAHALRQYSRRVELDVETLLLEALREASWFREAVQSSFPPEVLVARVDDVPS